MGMALNEEKRQHFRLRMTKISLANQVCQAGIIALYAWAGNVPWSIPLVFFLISVGTTIIFALMIVSGLNLRLKDKGLLLPQLIVACTIQVAFLIIEPKLWAVFLIAIFVAYMFGMISFSPSQFTKAWLVFCVVTAIALYLGRDRFGYPGTSYAEIAILWLFFSLALRRVTLIGAQFSHLREQLSEKNHQLSLSLAKIEELASHDDLTGAYNRRSFMQMLDAECQRAERTDQEFWVAILDLDHFKSVNDRFGHVVGDEALREFCKIAQSVMRNTDRFARYGGEEFVLLLTATTTPDEAFRAIERIRHAIERHDWNAIQAGLSVTMSAGATPYHRGESIEMLLSRADQALYKAKHAGRNRIEFGQPTALDATEECSNSL